MCLCVCVCVWGCPHCNFQRNGWTEIFKWKNIIGQSWTKRLVIFDEVVVLSKRKEQWYWMVSIFGAGGLFNHRTKSRWSPFVPPAHSLPSSPLAPPNQLPVHAPPTRNPFAFWAPRAFPCPFHTLANFPKSNESVDDFWCVEVGVYVPVCVCVCSLSVSSFLCLFGWLLAWLFVSLLAC